MADTLLEILCTRFEANRGRHPDLAWSEVRERLTASPGAMRSLGEMERTGGEPDVVMLDDDPGDLLFCDCAPQSPTGRRSVCYDQQALEARKKNKPRASAVSMAREMGAELLTETQYRRLQESGPFDTTTSSWLWTPPDIRERGGAIFGDHRFGRTFIYHNGAESYYAARGFRCILRV